MRPAQTIVVVTIGMILACGSSQRTGDTTQGGPGTWSDGTGVDDLTGVEGDATAVPIDGMPVDGTIVGEDGGVGLPLEGAAVSFALVNLAAEEELVFSMDRGWQPIIFAYSGEPPNATPIIMFPKFCTATCDAPVEGRCPTCPQPERVRDVKAAEKREAVPPGQTLAVPWDGQVFVYEKTQGVVVDPEGAPEDPEGAPEYPEGAPEYTECECWRKADPAPAEYTVKACGFRITRVANKRSRLQCVQTTMVLPMAEVPTTVSLEFPALPEK